MIVVLFLSLFLLALLAVLVALLGTTTSDDLSERARPERAWYPPLGIH